VLLLPDDTDAKISRWHFELRRHPGAFMLRPVSEQLTELDGQLIAKGAEAPIRPGSVVKVGRVLTLEFVSRAPLDSSDAGDATIGSQ
jgi:predicted component of type VI protein secretion system